MLVNGRYGALHDGTFHILRDTKSLLSYDSACMQNNSDKVTYLDYKIVWN